jgi:hypothetical protein
MTGGQTYFDVSGIRQKNVSAFYTTVDDIELPVDIGETFQDLIKALEVDDPCEWNLHTSSHNAAISISEIFP